MKSNTMAIAAKCWSSKVKPACSRGMDLIGATVIAVLSALPLTSNASQQSSMVRPLSRMATVLGFRDGHALFKACSDWSQPDLAQDAILIDDVLAEPRRG